MSEYPRDQFDDVPQYRDRTGSHRSGPVPAGSGPSGLLWISLAAALALVVGAFSYFVLPTLRPDGAVGAQGADGSDGAGAVATATPDTGSPAAESASSSGGQSSTTDPTPSFTEAPDATETPSVTASDATGSDATGSPEPTAAAQSMRPPAATATPEPTVTPEPTYSAEPTEAPEPTETEEPAPVDYSFPVEVYNASRINGLAAQAGGTLSEAGFTVTTADNWYGFPVDSSAVFYSSQGATAQAVAARLGLPAVYDGRVPGIAVVVTAG